MKRKRARADYSRLKSKLFITTGLIAVAAFVLILVLRIAFSGSSDLIVSFLQHAFHLSVDDATTIVRYTLRNNLYLIVPAATIVFFIVFMLVLSRRFLRYFDAINENLDAVTEGRAPAAALPAELGFLDQRLEHMKLALAGRERAAVQAEQRKNELVMYLAHDIKTPLTSVIGYLSLLDEAPDMPVEQKARYVRITLDKALRLESLINQFFEITRYNQTGQTLDVATIDLYYMLVQLAEEYYPMLAAGEKRVELHAPEDLTVEGDAGKLARVWGNILKNAITYSARGGAIHITAKRQPGAVVVSFANAGAKIPKEKLDAVFERFYRLDEARGQSTGGTGLGLAIAKEIVTLHRGSISAQSDDEWTVFTVTLPG